MAAAYINFSVSWHVALYGLLQASSVVAAGIHLHADDICSCLTVYNACWEAERMPDAMPLAGL